MQVLFLTGFAATFIFLSFEAVVESENWWRIAVLTPINAFASVIWPFYWIARFVLDAMNMFGLDTMGGMTSAIALP